MTGVGLRMAGLASLIGGLLDWLADLMKTNFSQVEQPFFDSIPIAVLVEGLQRGHHCF